jgi:NUDIX domain
MDSDDFKHRFAIGFPIDMANMEVALIRKRRGPAFNVGKLNGCGGHQKIGESPVGCIRREAKEEFGLDLPLPGQWQQFHYEHRVSNNNQLWFYTADVRNLRSRVKTMTDESVEIVSIHSMLIDMAKGHTRAHAYHNGIEHLGSSGSDFVYNLGYLIPMAACWLLSMLRSSGSSSRIAGRSLCQLAAVVLSAVYSQCISTRRDKHD